ncbi:ParA family protein [Tessaracoccus sp. OH4464_COT-324]|uniref:ParA family protein n=1 Tax=Tessaracoccus sp. OH4464_COT-324 TaxID=2491059 RepID=UPI000F63383C|nr:ParA family protein [Tessaracoccus sp. OH4464_COT-324]RRD46122.1 ParA family protein [Tessaracoccus sp. OH4464_COT-324]
MAIFFRKRRQPKPQNDEEFWKDHESVPRETGVPLPPGPRRAAYDLPEDYDYNSEYGDELQPEEFRRPTLPRPESPRVFVVANQKGGVGKTTTTVNIAMALALGGLNVLVIDNDPQANASTALGIDHPSGTMGTYEVLVEGDPIVAHAQPSPHSPNLHVLPAVIDLAAAEMELADVQGREARLKRALEQYIEQSGVDYVFIDCPPSLGMLTLNALVAATEILVPIQTEYYALEGVTALMNTIDRVKAGLNDQLQVSNILLTMFDRRTNLSRDVATEVRTHFPKQTLHVEIPRSVRIAEAPSFGQTVLTYQPRSEGAVAYAQVAEEIARQVESKD